MSRVVGAILIPADQHEHGWTHTLCALSALWERGKRPSVVPLSVYTVLRRTETALPCKNASWSGEKRENRKGEFLSSGMHAAKRAISFWRRAQNARLNSLCCASGNFFALFRASLQANASNASNMAPKKSAPKGGSDDDRVHVIVRIRPPVRKDEKFGEGSEALQYDPEKNLLVRQRLEYLPSPRLTT